jgi:hypothetical protein
MLDDEYKRVLLKAEIKWLNGLIAELESGEIRWNEKWLRQLAAHFEAGKPDDAVSQRRPLVRL